MKQKVKKWTSPIPKKCQICGKPLEKYFVDWKTVYGSWAIMCMGCFQVQGWNLEPGLGKGQIYETVTGIKVEG